MSTRIGPKIDLTANVLNLDAKNPASYNNIGSTWYDLSGYGNHFTLQGNPSSDSSKISFNQAGGNQYAICTNTTCGDFGIGDFTIEYVAYFPSNNQLYSSILSNNHGAYFNSGSAGSAGYSLGIVNQATFQDNGSLRNNGTEFFNANANIMPLYNQITHQVYTIKRGSTNSDEVTGSLYRTGSLAVTYKFTLGQTQYDDWFIRNPTYSPTSRYLGNSMISSSIYSLNIMRSAGSGYIATGSIYTIKIYNRILSQPEIQSNYTLYRNYYGF